MASLPTTIERTEDADFRAVANPSNHIVFPLDSSRGEKLQQLSETVQVNDFGLPLYYVRSDLLDWSQIDAMGRITYEELETAVEFLDYSLGYPTLKKGSPFWSTLPHEPHQAFLLFKSFLSLDESEGIRLLDSVAQHENMPLETIQEMSKEYLWSSRARAYDLFIVAAEAKRREARTRKAEDSHFTTAGTILDTIVTRLNDAPDLIQQMDGPELLSAMEQMIKIQRLSLGLTGANSSTLVQNPAAPGATVEVILRQLTKNSGLSDQASADIHQRLAALMSDPDAAMKAQELIIRATTGNQVVELP